MCRFSPVEDPRKYLYHHPVGLSSSHFDTFVFIASKDVSTLYIWLVLSNDFFRFWFKYKIKQAHLQIKTTECLARFFVPFVLATASQIPPSIAG